MMVIDPVTLKPISELRTSARNLTTRRQPVHRHLRRHLLLPRRRRPSPTRRPATEDGLARSRSSADGTLAQAAATGRWPPHVPDGRLPDRDRCPTGTAGSGSSPSRASSAPSTARPARCRPTQLPAGEEVTNSVATDETGGMYVVIDARALPPRRRRRRRARGHLARGLRPRHPARSRATSPRAPAPRRPCSATAGSRSTTTPTRRPTCSSTTAATGVDRPAALHRAGPRRQRQHDRQQPGRGRQLVHHREQLRLRGPARPRCSARPRRRAWRG